MSDLAVVPAIVKAVNNTSPGFFIAGEALTAGQVIGPPATGVQDNSQRPHFKKKNTDIATPGGDLLTLKMCLANTSPGQYASVAGTARASAAFPPGTIIDLGVSTTNNVLYFLSATKGGICVYGDLVSGDRIVIVGIGLGSNRLLFYPIDTALGR